MADREFATDVPASPPDASPSLARSFELTVRRGMAPALSVDGRNGMALAGLLPECRLVGRPQPADAAVRFHAGRLPGDRRPLLIAQPALLRAPPVRGRRALPSSLTLGRTNREGRLVGWAERLLQQDQWFSETVAARAVSVLQMIREARLGGRWWGVQPRLSASGRAVVFAGGDERLSRRMLSIAVAEQGAAWTILVTPRMGALALDAGQTGVSVLVGELDAWPLIEEAACVHAAEDDENGLLARLIGAPVHLHGPVGLAETNPVRLAAAALLLGARYVDPFTREPVSCEAFIEHAAGWRRQAGAAAEIACCVGVSFWKRRRIREMLGAHGAPAFRRNAASAVAVAERRGGGIAVWASRVPPGLDQQARKRGIPVSRIEDGFVRSAGLGADFLPPLSIVMDRLGLYYDATGPSDLEAILSDSRFAPELVARAGRLRKRIVQHGVTKYNLPSSAPLRLAAGGRPVLLVPGQVSDDRSVLLGGGGVRPGLALLAEIRGARPDAFIVYKPHPDVDAGHRPGAIPDQAVLAFADQIVRGGSMAALLEAVTEVHTLTSLTGFEALLRGKPVTTYGQPFYAGWGLTTDSNPVARRGRRLDLDELVAGALILYPRYLDPVSGLPCGPETVLSRLAEPGGPPSLLVRARRLQGTLLLRLRGVLRPLQKGAS